jgi:HK97 family phage prohead protease
MEDFSGWATKFGVRCTDGRIIDAEAFKSMDGKSLPLVWQHQHNSLDNVLGHVDLEWRPEGMWARGYMNGTENGENAKKMVLNKDLNSLSIFAKRLQQQGSLVKHGILTEVSLVKGGANAEARIENVNIMHGENIVGEDETEAVIYSGDFLQHDDSEGEIVGNQTDEQELAHAEADTEETIQDVIDSMSEKQKNVMYLVVDQAIEAQNEGGTAAHSDEEYDEEEFLAHIDGTIAEKIKEGFANMGNVFEQTGTASVAQKERPRLSKEQIQKVLEDGPKYGGLEASFLAHADEYGIEDINFLFPDSKLDQNGITWVSRRTEWVSKVLDGVHKSPFTRVKSLSADITADEARAKGYVKGNRKKDEVIKLLKRVTEPTTVYKKQKLDRDDIVDITEVDILAWIKGEMRVMLDEEIARAILVGDNREVDDEDKIDEDKLRPIAYDDDLYNTTVEISSTLAVDELIDKIVEGLNDFKGTGTPTFFTTRKVFTKMILSKDGVGRRLYATKAELAAALTVDDIVTVEAMEINSDIVGIAVNLYDYNVGADRGGEVNLFDFFDIDYNQQKYLLETRISGALVKPKSAVTFVVNAEEVLTPQAPTFVNSTGVLTIPAQTGVIYKNKETGVTFNSGAQTAISVGQTVEVEAVPDEGYGLTHNSQRVWEFTRTA